MLATRSLPSSWAAAKRTQRRQGFGSTGLGARWELRSGAWRSLVARACFGYKRPPVRYTHHNGNCPITTARVLSLLSIGGPVIHRGPRRRLHKVKRSGPLWVTGGSCGKQGQRATTEKRVRCATRSGLIRQPARCRRKNVARRAKWKCQVAGWAGISRLLGGTCRIKVTLMGREAILLLLDKRQCRTKPLIFNNGGRIHGLNFVEHPER
jgi:hypothetical protein